MDELNSTGLEETTTAPVADEYDPEDWSDLEEAFSVDEGVDGDAEDTTEDREETDEADQQSQEEPDDEAEQRTDADEQAEEQNEADQPTFELKRMGETRTVGRAEVITLAQKGMDYDHIRGERDTARSRLAELEGFLNELAQPGGMSIEDLIDSTRADVLAAKENIDKSVALQRVKLERDRKAFEAEKQNASREQERKSAEEKRIEEACLRFAKDFPDVEPKDIPKDVWDKVIKEGRDLSSVYSLHENKRLKEEVKALREKAATAEKNNKNKSRSTGSQRTSGASKEMDAFDRDWYDGT